MTSLKLILLIEQVLPFSQKNPALNKKMTEAYHNEALRKQRIVDKKQAALARMIYAQVLWIVIVQFFFLIESLSFTYTANGKRQIQVENYSK